MDSLETNEKKSILNEQTLIPLSFMMILAGGIIWLTNIWAISQANSQAISALEKTAHERDTEISRKFDRIIQDLSYIKGQIDSRGSDASKSRGKRHIQD